MELLDAWYTLIVSCAADVSMDDILNPNVQLPTAARHRKRFKNKILCNVRSLEESFNTKINIRDRCS